MGTTDIEFLRLAINSPVKAVSHQEVSATEANGPAVRGSSLSSGFRQTSEFNHVELCPMGAAATRWYLCGKHVKSLVFQAGTGQMDSVANSCPVCGNLSPQYAGCTCEHSLHPLDRAKRPGRRIRRGIPPPDQA